MPSTDDRIVAMQFDNKSFEEKLATTMGSLEKLQKSLDFTNANKNMGDLSKAASAFNLAGIGTAVEGIAGKFTAMGAIAFSVIDNIVTKAIGAGVNIVKSLSLDQVISGFQEYETNMNSIQTIMANTRADGTNLDQVNAALDTLNQYSDQTIYNFGEMAKNIGTFTAAGVDLDTSVNAIKGIANLAAISGSNSQQASTAMYQLSQALASGTVKLMDWNSIVNAGMGGEVFQKALFETGRALGTIKDLPMGQSFEEWKDAGNSFRGSLEEGWLTAEVLTNTLSGFTGDLTEAQILSMGYTKEQAAEIIELGKSGKEAATKVKTLTQLIGTVKESVGSGWSASFRIIIGDFEQAKELFTDLSNAIGGFVGNQADARNELLQGWADLGGRTKLIEGLKDVFEAVGQVIRPIAQAFRSIFPATTAEKLFELTKSFREFAFNLRISGETADKIRTIFAGVFGALEIGWTIIKEGVRAVGELFSAFTDQNGSAIVDFFTGLAEKIAFFNGQLVAGGGIREFFDNLVEAVKNPGEFIDDLKTKITDFFSGIDFGTVDGLVDAFTRIKDSVVGLIDKWDPTMLDGIKDFFAGVFGNFDLETSNSMEGGLGRLGDRLSWLGDVLKGAGRVFGWFGEKLGEFFDKIGRLKDWVSEKIQGVVDTVTGLGPALLDAVKKLDFDQVMEIIQTGIAAVFAGGFSNISKNGLGIDFTGGSLASISEFFQDLKGVGGSLKTTLGEVTDTLEAMQLKLKAEALQKIAIAMGILAVSMILLSTVDPIALGTALAAMAVGFGQLATTMALLSKVVATPSDAAKLGTLAAGLILLAGAMLIMAVAVKIFSTMNMEELGKGLGAITILLGELVLVAQLMQGNTKGMITAGIGIMAMAVALNILAVAVKIFSTMSWEELAKGLGSIAVALGLITAAVKLLPAKGMLSTGAGLLLIAVALNFLTTAMKMIATMSWEDIGKGLVGVAGGLLAIALGLKFMPKGPSMIAAGIGLLAISVSLNLMATALKLLATMSWGDIAKSLVAMAGALIILVVAARAMESGVAGAIAIGLMAVSLGLLVKVLKEFAKLSWSELLKGLAGLAATLLVLGAAAYILSPVVVSMLGLGVAMLALGAGFALFGLGAGLFAAAFMTVAEAGRAGVDLLLYAFDQLLARLPAVVEGFGGAILLLIQKVLDAVPDMVAAIGEIIVAILQAIIDAAPKLGETFVVLIQTGLKAIRDIVPDIVATGFAILIALLTGIRDNIAEIVTLVADIITNFLDALALKVPEIIDSVYNLVIAIIEGVITKLADIASFLVPKGLELLQGLWDGIKEKAEEVYTWFKDLPGAIIEELGDQLKTLYYIGKDLLQGFRDGVDFVWDGLYTWLSGLPEAIVEAVGDLITLLEEAGKDVIRGLWNGIKSMKTWIGDRMGEVGGWISSPFKSVLGIGSPSKVFMGYGMDVGDGLALGLIAMGAYIQSTASKMADHIVAGFSPDSRALATRTVDAMNTALTMAAEQVGTMKELAPTITPVLDLSLVRNEASKLGSILATASEVGSSAFGVARNISIDQMARLEAATEEPDVRAEVRDVTFTQINQSPEALSTADIARNTRNQIIMAKEELRVPV